MLINNSFTLNDITVLDIYNLFTKHYSIKLMFGHFFPARK